MTAGYGLEGVQTLDPDDRDRPRIRFLCGCSQVTIVTLDPSVPGHPGIGRHIFSQEVAYTCDGCGTSHWFTVADQHIP